MRKRYLFDTETVHNILDIDGVTYTSFMVFEGTEFDFLMYFPHLETALEVYKSSLIDQE